MFLDIKKFRQQLCKLRGTHMESVFTQRTEESSASQYFQFYGYLSQQQNMMQDFVRTSTYQKAIHGNLNDFNVSFFSYQPILSPVSAHCAVKFK